MTTQILKPGMKFTHKSWPNDAFIQIDKKHGRGFMCSGWPSGMKGCYFQDFYEKWELIKMQQINEN